ncbi:MAG: sodium:solute symporter [Planctomycetota bacterium]
MNLNTYDWLIVLVVVVGVTALALYTKQYMRSVADFLAANRCAGRYLMTMASGMSTFALVSMVAAFEMYYNAGFSPMWWSMSTLPLSIGLTMVGYLIYRFRETRVFTLGQFFEIRYSKSFRKAMGLLAWLSGIINFGVFPAVCGRFFIYFCGLPEHFGFLGITWSTYVVIMAVLLLFAMFFTIWGGQIAVMVTDFGQGMFCNVALLFVVAFVLINFPWHYVTESMTNQPPGKSLVNPFDTAAVEGFGLWYFLIGYLGMFVSAGNLAWQGSQGYNVSARDANELRMTYVLGFFRAIVYSLIVFIIALGAYVAMHHPHFSDIANKTNDTLNTVTNEYLRRQIRVSAVMPHIFPAGLMGVLCAMMFASFVAVHDTYMHSWGTIFIQDVILPFRKKPFTPKQHLLLLRLSVIFVTLFIFLFSLWFRQYEYIFMYFWITGAIFTGGISGPIILGLYWRRGTAAAAWTSTIYGSTLAVGTIVLSQLWPAYHTQIASFVQKFWPAFQDTAKYPINGFYMTFGITISSMILYILVSLLIGRKQSFNLERMLHRGKYAIKDDKAQEFKRGLAAVGFQKSIPWKDKIIYLAVGGWFLTWFIVWIIMTIYQLTIGISDIGWSRFWQIYIYAQYALVVIVIVWFMIGGVKDLRRLFRDLATMERNDLDDGMVVDHHSLGEEIADTNSTGT